MPAGCGLNRKAGGMPKENINDLTQTRWRTEVSWRPQERVCSCGAIWQAPVPDCPDCHRKDIPITSGHVQLATVNLDSEFTFPAGGDGGEPEPFDGWRTTLDPAAIERTVDALMKAGAQAFPDWKRDWSTSSD